MVAMEQSTAASFISGRSSGKMRSDSFIPVISTVFIPSSFALRIYPIVEGIEVGEMRHGEERFIYTTEMSTPE
jgi:hypothetical protein